MNVQGSAFYFGNEVDSPKAKFTQYFALLATQPPTGEWPLHRPFLKGYAYRRRLFINELPDAWCGVILSARATEFHHYVKQVGNVVSVIARETGPDAPVEVNFFCIRKDSNKGIYSNYFGSYAFGGFLNDLWHTYRWFVQNELNECLRSLSRDASADEVAQVKDQFSLRARGVYAPIYNPKSFEELVRQLTEVDEVRLTTYNVDTPTDRPVSNRINNVHKVYRLEEGKRALDNKLYAWILKKKEGATRLLKRGGSSFSGSVLGTDRSGELMTIPFNSTLDDHLNFDYDKIGSFDATNLASNPCLAAMLSKLRSGVMFGP